MNKVVIEEDFQIWGLYKLQCVTDNFWAMHYIGMDWLMGMFLTICE